MKALEISREILSKEVIVDKTTAKIFTLFSFVVFTALGAYVHIPLPFTPVPLTLQTFFVLLAGAVLSKKWGAFSQFGYVFLGTIGLPIFAGAASGLSALSGPTGGYLCGFILASWLLGTILPEQRNAEFIQILLSMFLGSLVILFLGCIWLAVLLKLSLKQVLILGLWPFLPGDVIKSIAAAFLYYRIQNRTKQLLF